MRIKVYRQFVNIKNHIQAFILAHNVCRLYVLSELTCLRDNIWAHAIHFHLLLYVFQWHGENSNKDKHQGSVHHTSGVSRTTGFITFGLAKVEARSSEVMCSSHWWYITCDGLSCWHWGAGTPNISQHIVFLSFHLAQLDLACGFTSCVSKMDRLLKNLYLA